MGLKSDRKKIKKKNRTKVKEKKVGKTGKKWKVYKTNGKKSGRQEGWKKLKKRERKEVDKK